MLGEGHRWDMQGLAPKGADGQARQRGQPRVGSGCVRSHPQLGWLYTKCRGAQRECRKIIPRE